MATPEPARPPLPRRIMGYLYAQALAEAGLIVDIDNVNRVVVDVKSDSVLTVWVEYFADERWLAVLPGEGVLVRRRPAQPDSVTAERLDAARRALLEDGFFREDQVGEDIAPRIIERLADLRMSLHKTQQAMAAMQEKVVCYRVNGQDVDPAQVQVVYQPMVDADPPEVAPGEYCQAE